MLKRELIKLSRRLTFIVIVVAVLVQVLLVLRYQQAAADEYQPWANDIARLEEICANDPARAECGPGGDLASARQQARFVAGDFPLATAMQDPAGMIGVATSNLASLIGALAIAIFGAAYVGTEWSGRTIAVTIARDPRRGRLVAAQFLSLGTAALTLLTVSTLVLAVMSRWLRVTYTGVPPSPVGFDTAPWALHRLAAGILVILVLVALVLLVAHIAKSVLFAFTWLLAVFGGIHALALVDVIYQFTPTYWIAAWMRLRSENLFADHVWLDTFPLFGESAKVAPHEPWTPIAIGMFGVVALWLAFFHVRSTDIII